MDKLEFAASIIPHFNERWEVYSSNPKDLIGKKVISITNGYSGSAGQIMVIDNANEHQIHFVKCEESKNVHDSHRGWGCSYSERASQFIFFNENHKYEI